MMTRILLLAFTVAAFSSCSTLYKSGQTPDDVYYSPGAERSGYVDQERDGYVDLDDRYLRMKSSSRRWSAFDDDFMYWNNPGWNSQFMFNSWGRPMLGFGYGSMWGNPFFGGFNPYYGFNAFHGNPYSPFYYGSPVVIINKPVPTNPRANGPRTFNLNTYRANTNGYVDPKTGKTIYSSTPSSGNTGIRIFSNSNNTNRTGNYINTESRPRGGYNNYDGGGYRNSSPSRTFEPSSGGGRSGGGGTTTNSGGGGGSAPVRSFNRGGN